MNAEQFEQLLHHFDYVEFLLIIGILSLWFKDCSGD